MHSDPVDNAHSSGEHVRLRHLRLPTNQRRRQAFRRRKMNDEPDLAALDMRRCFPLRSITTMSPSIPPRELLLMLRRVENNSPSRVYSLPSIHRNTWHINLCLVPNAITFSSWKSSSISIVSKSNGVICKARNVRLCWTTTIDCHLQCSTTIDSHL